MPEPTTPPLPGHMVRWHVRAQKHRAEAGEIQLTIDHLQDQIPLAPLDARTRTGFAQYSRQELEAEIALLREEMDASLELAHYAQMRADLSRRPDGVWLSGHKFSAGTYSTLRHLHTNAATLVAQSGELVREAEQAGNRRLLADVWPVYVCATAAAFDFAAILGAIGRRNITEPDVTYPADRPWPEHAGPRPEIPVPADPGIASAGARLRDIARARRAEAETTPNGHRVRDELDPAAIARDAVAHVTDDEPAPHAAIRDVDQADPDN